MSNRYGSVPPEIAGYITMLTHMDLVGAQLMNRTITALVPSMYNACSSHGGNVIPAAKPIILGVAGPFLRGSHRWGAWYSITDTYTPTRDLELPHECSSHRFFMVSTTVETSGDGEESLYLVSEHVIVGSRSHTAD